MSPNQREVYIIDGSTDVIENTIQLPVGISSPIKVNPTLNKIYIGGTSSNLEVVVVDGQTNKFEKSFTEFGTGGDFDVDTDTNKLYANNRNFGHVAVFIDT